MKAFNSFHDGILTYFSPRQIDFSFPFEKFILTAEQKRDLFVALPSVPQEVITIKQIHAADIIKVDAAFLAAPLPVPEADGLLTDRVGVALTVRTADCLPVYLFDPRRRCVGLVHAGWRGTAAQIAGKAVKMMQEQYGCSLKDLRILLGPAIRPCCYIVGEEFVRTFPAQTLKRGEHFYFDLPMANRAQLLCAGVLAENINDCGLCTSCGGEFFSFRREGKAAGRHLALIMLV